MRPYGNTATVKELIVNCSKTVALSMSSVTSIRKLYQGKSETNAKTMRVFWFVLVLNIASKCIAFNLIFCQKFYRGGEC